MQEKTGSANFIRFSRYCCHGSGQISNSCVYSLHVILLFLFLFSRAGLLSAEESDISDRLASAPFLFWDFSKSYDTEGWTIAPALNGTVSGGTLWLTVQKEPKYVTLASWPEQVWGPNLTYRIVSPAGLSVPAYSYNQVVIRLRNISPETDGILRWLSEMGSSQDSGMVRFSMRPDCQEWQTVVCHLDERWKGTIGQISIQPAQMWMRGDIWIDWIAITRGEPLKTRPRPDLCSDQVVPRIQLPGISQDNFKDAFKVLDECLVTDVPLRGFNYPFLAPGGAYGENWWQLDGSLNLAGAKWVDQQLAEGVIRGFTEVQNQNPDGRIDLWGGSPIRGQTGDVSSLPRYFEAAYDVFRRTGDASLQHLIFESMKKYLGYWFSPNKRDKATGLITALFEETFSNPQLVIKQDRLPDGIAPVDLNVAVAVGCYNTARMAHLMGKEQEAAKYTADFDRLSQDINQYLWNDEDHVYYNFNINSRTHYKMLTCSTFDPMRLGIAPPDRVEKLIPVLLNPVNFNWGIRPLTTIAKTDPAFCEAKGTYDGRGWFGDVWTLRNLEVIRGLKDAGKHDLAADLNWSTIKTFNGKYCEFIVPSTGSAEGVQRYGWSASQFISALIENLFGIDYDRTQMRLRIVPIIPKALWGQEIAISHVKIPSNDSLYLDIRINQKREGKASVRINLKGAIPPEMLEIYLPTGKGQKIIIKDKKGKSLEQAGLPEGLKNVTGVRISMAAETEVSFE